MTPTRQIGSEMVMSHPVERDRGIVTVETKGFNQDGTVVISFTRTIMVTRREHLQGAEIPRIRRP